MLRCPFCGSSETDRISLEGRRFIVFGCMFTPEVAPELDEAAAAEYLGRAFQPGSAHGYFRGMCDRMHLFVTQGEGGKRLIAEAAGPGPKSAEGPGRRRAGRGPGA